MRTRLVLETAPGSSIGTVGLLVSQWESLAKEVDKLVKPTAYELILWRLTYNWHQETSEEFEENEKPPIPLMFGKVMLIDSRTLWELGQCPHIVVFCCRELALQSMFGNKILSVDAEVISSMIANCLRNKA